MAHCTCRAGRVPALPLLTMARVAVRAGARHRRIRAAIRRPALAGQRLRRQLRAVRSGARASGVRRVSLCFSTVRFSGSIRLLAPPSPTTQRPRRLTRTSAESLRMGFATHSGSRSGRERASCGSATSETRIGKKSNAGPPRREPCRISVGPATRATARMVGTRRPVYSFVPASTPQAQRSRPITRMPTRRRSSRARPARHSTDHRSAA